MRGLHALTVTDKHLPLSRRFRLLISGWGFDSLAAHKPLTSPGILRSDQRVQEAHPLAQRSSTRVDANPRSCRASGRTPLRAELRADATVRSYAESAPTLVDLLHDAEALDASTDDLCRFIAYLFGHRSPRDRRRPTPGHRHSATARPLVCSASNGKWSHGRPRCHVLPPAPRRRDRTPPFAQTPATAAATTSCGK
jgi:hypothetical protein